MDTLLKSGQFAKLCRTTKETLRHYERVGVLRPALQEENGYKSTRLPRLPIFPLLRHFKVRDCLWARSRISYKNLAVSICMLYCTNA